MAYYENPMAQFMNLQPHAAPDPMAGGGDATSNGELGPADGGVPTNPMDEGAPPEMPPPGPPSPPPPPMPTDATPAHMGSFARPDQRSGMRPFRAPDMTQFGPGNRHMQDRGPQSFGPGAPIVGGQGGAPTFDPNTSGAANPESTDDLMRRLSSVLQQG